MSESPVLVRCLGKDRLVLTMFVAKVRLSESKRTAASSISRVL
jgi:hypothetical protein